MHEQSLFIQGNEKAVLLLHAFTGTPKDLQLLANAIAREGYTVYTPLFTGHGTSNIQDLLAVDPTRWQQDAREAIECLQAKGYENIAALGLSLGGVMATSLAVEQLVIAAGTFCSPVTPRFAQLDGLHATFMAYAKQLLGKTELSPTQMDETLQKLAPQAHRMLQAIDQLTQAIATNVSHITGPFYIAQGGQDQLVDPEASIELKEQLVNAWVDFHWFEEAGHIITIGKDRLAFQQSVVQFLEQVNWR